MKTWLEFNEAVSDLLLIDGVRKGRGIERFRDRQILNGVRDLQTFIPSLRDANLVQSYTETDLEDHSEGHAEVGDFDHANARFTDIVVRRIPTEENGLKASVYYKPKVYSSLARFQILDGGSVPRSASYPGKIFFEHGKFYSSPILREDETLSIYYTQERNYKPLYACNTAERVVETKLGDDEALAVSHYVKFHFHRDMNDDNVASNTNLQVYQKLRRELYFKYREVVDSSGSVSTIQPLTEEGFLLGDG